MDQDEDDEFKLPFVNRSQVWKYLEEEEDDDEAVIPGEQGQGQSTMQIETYLTASGAETDIPVSGSGSDFLTMSGPSPPRGLKRPLPEGQPESGQPQACFTNHPSHTSYMPFQHASCSSEFNTAQSHTSEHRPLEIPPESAPLMETYLPLPMSSDLNEGRMEISPASPQESSLDNDLLLSSPDLKEMAPRGLKRPLPEGQPESGQPQACFTNHPSHTSYMPFQHASCSSEFNTAQSHTSEHRPLEIPPESAPLMETYLPLPMSSDLNEGRMEISPASPQESSLDNDLLLSSPGPKEMVSAPPLESSLADDFQFSDDFFWAYIDSEEESDEQPSVPPTWSEPPQEDDDADEDDEEESVSGMGEKETPLYEGAACNIWESLVAILSFIQCEHISGAGLRRLLELINLHLPQPNNFLKTYEQLFKLIEDLDQPVDLHYFCSHCHRIRKSATDICDKCTDEKRTVLFFISFPLAAQLARMFKRPEFVEFLKHRHQRCKETLDNIEDVYDGDVYRELSEFLSSHYNITLLWNSDGVQVFKNNFSLWPFYLVINELPPEIRFLSENLLIAGVWGCTTKPHPNLFLLPICKEVKALEAGVNLEVHGEDEIQVVRAKITCGCCDAPATAMFLNMKIHSGFYSCPVCLTRGEKPSQKDSTVFPYDEDAPLRIMADYENHKRLAVDLKLACTKSHPREELCRGIKGPTILSDMVPDIFRYTSIDSMHCVYLGVMKHLLCLWFDKDYKDHRFSIHSKIKLVSLRLSQLAPPHFLQRLPQIIEKLIYWKATELRSFLFNLALPLLEGVLKDDVYDHFSMFVQGVALLNSSSISQDDLAESSRLLNLFVQQFPSIYGATEMTHNLHMLVHLSRCVQLHGPLWAYSCFKMEDINGRILNLIHGTKHVGLQIHTNLSIITGLPLMISNMKESKVKVYCQRLLHKRHRLHITDKIDPGVYCVGKFSEITDEKWIVDNLIENGIVKPESTVQVFLRLLKNNVQYVSERYKRSGRRVSSFVKYVDDGNVTCYGSIHFFVKISCNCNVDCHCLGKNIYMALIKPTNVLPYCTNSVSVRHLFKCHTPAVADSYDFVTVHHLQKVLFRICCDGQMVLAEPLNKFELE